MAKRRIKDAKDLTTGELIYFRGHAKATYLSDGSTLEDKISNIEKNTGIGVGIISITYSDLVDLRNNSKLNPGTKYRITDYITTTSQENTQSAGHQFDIIVEALSENILSEDAKAIQNENVNDGHFDESNLEAWELKYCLDNDTSRFAWADVNGKGVIYYMKDEFNNECPYDFKNILFVRYRLNSPTVSGYNNEWQNQLSKNVNEMFKNNHLSYIWHGSNNESYYWDYNEVFSTVTEETKAFYTFSNVINDDITDKSLTNVCYSNVIKESYRNNVLELNNNIFFSTNINNYCYHNSFGDYCYHNSFGDYCYSNSFGNYCYSNSFSDNCDSNSLDNNCKSNSFGNNCKSNNFGNYCDSNSFGNYCGSNSFGNDCCHNSFGGGCESNSFGNGCTSNSFGNGCYHNSFGDYCYSNSFGNYCQLNGFYDDPSYSFSEDFGEYIGNSEKLNYVQCVTLNEGCHHLLFHTSKVINEENIVQNITVTKGVKSIETDNNGSFIPLLLDIPVTNNEYEIKVARNSKGEIKIYSEADLIG